MPGDAGHPASVLARPEAEAADDALTAFVVAVEDVDGESLASFDRLSRREELRVVRIAEDALPEADVARGDIEVAGQTPEVGPRGRL